MVGCALAAARRTVDSSIAVHSMHVYFVDVASPARDILFDVRRVRNGRSFATRTVNLRQNGKTVVIATVQFHHLEPSNGLLWQPAMPDVSPPESLKDRREVFGELREKVRAKLRAAGKDVS